MLFFITIYIPNTYSQDLPSASVLVDRNLCCHLHANERILQICQHLKKCRRRQQIRLLLIAFGNFLHATNLKFCNCYFVISDNSTED